MSIFQIYNNSNQYTGNLYESAEARVAASRREGLGELYGDLDMKSSLFATAGEGINDVSQQMGRELGINKTLQDDNLSFDHYVTSTNDKSNIMFQGEDGNLYNLNFSAGSADGVSTEKFAKDNGLISNGDKFYDVVHFGQDSANFTDYAFEGLGDGKQDSQSVGLGNNTWSNMNWVRQEVNTKLWGNGGSDLQSQTANNAFSNITKHADQWLTDEQYDILQSIESHDEFLKKLAEFAVKAMDETGQAEYGK